VTSRLAAEIVVPSGLLSRIRESVLSRRDVESSLFATAAVVRRDGRAARFLVREIFEPGPDDYLFRDRMRVGLAPSFVAHVTSFARANNRSVVLVHSHPWPDSEARFSTADDAGEDLLEPFFERRLGPRLHGALLVTPSELAARVLPGRVPARIVVPDRPGIENGIREQPTEDVVYSRQVLAFGSVGQHALSRLRIGIVGVGGTGSVVAQQLAHLGIRQFLLVDYDRLDATNLNRVVGSRPDVVNAPKTVVAGAMIRGISPSASVEEVPESVLEESVARRVTECDFCFFCTDSQASRAILNQIAYQYYVPSIDMGVIIAVSPDTTTRKAGVTHIAGRVQLLAPGHACLTCTRLLDSNAIRRELMLPPERVADPYFVGASQPQPAVISLNSTVASLAVTMFLSVATGIPGRARHQIYDAISGAVRPVSNAPDDGCITCSMRGALGRGDDWPLPTRPA